MKKIVAVFAMLVLFAACGGDDGGGGGGDRPSTEEIATALKDADNAVGSAFAAAGGASEAAIDCIAKALHDSDLSDGTLKALVDGDADYEGSKEDNELLTSGELTTEITKCATEAG